MLHSNLFQNTNNRIVLGAPTIPGPPAIDATYNNWGQYNLQDIENVVIHYGSVAPDGTNYKQVNYSPFNTSGGGGGGGCPFVLSQRGGRFEIENSILGRGEYRGTIGPPVWDAVEVKGFSRDENGVGRVRLQEMESDHDVLDQVRAIAVRVPADASIGTDETGAIVGFRQVRTLDAVRAWSGRNAPFISPIAPGSAYRGEAGDSLDYGVEDPDAGIVVSRRIAVSLIPKPQGAPSSGGRTGVTIRVSCEASGGRWETIGDLIPKEDWSTSLTQLPNSGDPVRRVRIVWNTNHTLGWAGLVDVVPATVRDLPTMSIRHSDGTDATAALARADAASVSVGGHEYVELAYDGRSLEEGERVFVVARGYYHGAGAPEQQAPPARAFAEQNRPNPFNPATEIRFALPSSGDVAIRVFDVRGRLVRVLVDRAYPAGYHAVEWDGTDRAGHQVASGVYFYEAQLGGKAIRRRMVLLR